MTAAIRTVDCPIGAHAVELESFYRAGRFLSAILDLDELLRAILEEGLDAVGGTRGFVGIVNRSTGELELRITAGQGWDLEPKRSIKITGEAGHGITQWVAYTGVPYVAGDVRRDPHYVMFFPDVRSEIAVPLVNRDGRTIGVINVESEKIDAFSQRDLQLLVALANQAAIAFSVANHRAREAALIEVGSELASATDREELLSTVVERSAELLRADDCSLFQLDAEGERLVLRATGRHLQGKVGSLTYRLGEGLTGWVAKEGAAVRVEDVREDPRWRGLYPELPAGCVEAYLAVPVFTREALWGVLRVVRRKPEMSVLSNAFTARDEALLTTLAGQVGAALTQQALVDRQLRMERMAAWGEMSARSAHMIGNKVFALKGQLNELEHLSAQPEFSPEAVLEVVERAKQGVFRLEEILTEFRDFLMATHVEKRPADLSELVESAVADSFPRCCCTCLQLELARDLPPVSIDASRMKRAVSELVENAIHYQEEGGTLRVVTGRWTPEDRKRYPEAAGRLRPPRGHAVRLEVIDSGPGVPEANKQKLFNPFFTTRSRGMGLGLSIVKGIVDAHGGSIAEVGLEGRGAHFIILLPVEEGAAAAEADGES